VLPAEMFRDPPALVFLLKKEWYGKRPQNSASRVEVKGPHVFIVNRRSMSNKGVRRSLQGYEGVGRTQQRGDNELGRGGTTVERLPDPLTGGKNVPSQRA